MLYTDAIYLILAILLFSSWPAEATLPLPEIFLAWFIKEISLLLLAVYKFKRARTARDFISAQTFLKFLAFGCFALDVIILEIPAFIPQEKSFLKDLVGVILFLHYLILVWAVAAFYEKRSPLANISVPAYVLSHLKLLFPFLLPWFLVNALFSLLEGRLPFNQGIYGELFYFVCFLGAIILLMPPLAVKTWECKPFPVSNIRRIIEDYISRERARLGGIYLWETFRGKLLTAGVIGVVPRFRYLLISRGLLATLEEAEVLSVVAHEIGHIKRHHMFWLLTFFVLFSLIIYFAFIPLYLVFLAYFPRPDLLVLWGGENLLLPEALLTIGLAVSVVLYFRFLLGFFLRNFERQADLYCLESLGTAQGLVRAFKKIAAISGHTEDVPSWHHFSIRQRIEFLEAAESDPTLISRHHRKVKLCLVSYLFLAVLLIGLFNRLPAEHLEKRARLNLYYGELLEEARVFGNPEVLALLGHVAYELGREKEALNWYEKALTLKEDPEILNNMAWILATTKDKALKDPKKALSLAQKATAQKLTAIHLDTLAEAWFANGNPQRACLYATLAARRAELAPDFYENLRYYRQQKEKFCHAERTP
ncbi:Tetratricopeptide TPR_1 repeat-containing protein [Thermodesulfatator indicus DSM 15286]|uniref:Tetratricopeptide TPR_1 repeat-containing protein n=1 Tax=Thermodesulfatator indicus (strain DSM 15286 / JCM 11887 / CIR29812) TaxID=667014 RepID=F8ABE5_THEID|nr:M48 family metallopeptidase [Thermodesulfatator indicus]AEH44455.1 Tetratricopeptide TPR_1 repeat-containing protein [Thermodesulfatator indicus DSM 15286]